jgi:hypothetical protein
MTKLRWVYLAFLGALLLLVGVPYGVLKYRIAKSIAFCEAVSALPRPELALVESRCERLVLQRGGPVAGLDFIRDTNVLVQFSLAGRTPYEIVVQQDTVALKYIKGNWRYDTLAIWEHDDTGPNGDPVTVFKIASGSGGWWILNQRSEPAGAGHPDR